MMIEWFKANRSFLGKVEKVNVCRSIIETIGKTPLVKLSRLTKGLNGHILAKAEFFNPGFSKKDRIALQTIEEAEQARILKPGQPIIELTSGNTGTGYAVVCTHAMFLNKSTRDLLR